MVGLNFKEFLGSEKSDTILVKTKLNWKRDFHGYIPHRVFQCPQCDNDKISKQCDMSPKMNCFQCELVKACRNCLNKKTEIKYYSTGINESKKRLPENEFGFMLPHYKRILD